MLSRNIAYPESDCNDNKGSDKPDVEVIGAINNGGLNPKDIVDRPNNLNQPEYEKPLRSQTLDMSKEQQNTNPGVAGSIPPLD